MLGFAGHEFFLDQIIDGATQREHLRRIQEQTGVKEPELLPVECPEQVKYVWDYYKRSSFRRGDGPVNYTEIMSWSRLSGTPLEPFEVALLDALENLYWMVKAKMAPKK